MIVGCTNPTRIYNKYMLGSTIEVDNVFLTKQCKQDGVHAVYLRLTNQQAMQSDI